MGKVGGWGRSQKPETRRDEGVWEEAEGGGDQGEKEFGGDEQEGHQMQKQQIQSLVPSP